MEWALSIPRGQVLAWLEEPRLVKETDSLADVWEVCEGLLGPPKFTRMYFGQEFCEKALPSPKELDQALAWAKQLGIEFTLAVLLPLNYLRLFGATCSMNIFTNSGSN